MQGEVLTVVYYSTSTPHICQKLRYIIASNINHSKKFNQPTKLETILKLIKKFTLKKVIEHLTQRDALKPCMCLI